MEEVGLTNESNVPAWLLEGEAVELERSAEWSAVREGAEDRTWLPTCLLSHSSYVSAMRTKH